MTDLRFYFDGTNGTPVNGEVLLDVMISKEEKPKDIGQLKFRYSDSFFLHSACSYDHELAIMSLGLTMSAFTYKADGDKHARAALHAIGCDDRTIESFRFDDQQSCADSCGYIIAAKSCRTIPSLSLSLSAATATAANGSATRTRSRKHTPTMPWASRPRPTAFMTR